LAGAAEKHQLLVTFRNLPEALGLSDRFRVSLDISRHDDPIAFLKQHGDRITHVIVKDRTKATGTAEKFGEGDTPIKPVLAYLKETKSPLRAFVEYEYFGLGTAPEELKKCMTYVRSSLG
jgi:sugar phosphate isomerase/epimerase